MRKITRNCSCCSVKKELSKSNFRLRRDGLYDRKCKKCAYEKQKPITKAWVLQHPNYYKILYQLKTPAERKKDRLNRVKYIKTHPWFRAYKTSTTRCRYDSNSSYYQRGIEHSLTVADFKELWKRDSASSLKEPSINRIDPNLGYIKGNVEYIELEDNLKGKQSKRYSNSLRDY